MSKRKGNELNHDNWDKEDEKKEEAGSFTPLSDSELKNRVIKQARRSKIDPETGSPRSPFTAFSGFNKNPTQPSFNFLASQSPASFGSPAATSIPEASNGKPPASTSASTEELDKGPAQSAPKRPSSSESTKSEDNSIEYFHQLQNLNESVLKWMQLHIAKNPCCDFTPVFNDYKLHLQNLDSAYPSRNKNVGLKSSECAFKVPQQKTVVPTDTPPQRFFSSEKTSLNLSSKEADKASFGIPSAMTFGFKNFSPLPETKLGSSSSDDSAKASAPFSFGLKSGFGEASAFGKPSTDTKAFSFKDAVDSSSKSAAASHPDEEEYVPPKNEFATVSEDDALYSKRCKLFFQKDGAYVEKGIGTLYLKSLDERTQLLVRADTNLGNVLLNIMLSTSLPMERTGKNNVLIVCVPNPPLDAKNPDTTSAIPLLIRVKTSGDADELLEKLNQYKS